MLADAPCAVSESPLLPASAQLYGGTPPAAVNGAETGDPVVTELAGQLPPICKAAALTVRLHSDSADVWFASVTVSVTEKVPMLLTPGVPESVAVEPEELTVSQEAPPAV